jgi:hypothetical protein
MKGGVAVAFALGEDQDLRMRGAGAYRVFVRERMLALAKQAAPRSWWAPHRALAYSCS